MDRFALLLSYKILEPLYSDSMIKKVCPTPAQ